MAIRTVCWRGRRRIYRDEAAGWLGVRACAAAARRARRLGGRGRATDAHDRAPGDLAPAGYYLLGTADMFVPDVRRAGRSVCARTGCRGATSPGRSGSSTCCPQPTAVEERSFGARRAAGDPLRSGPRGAAAGVLALVGVLGRAWRGAAAALLVGLLVFAVLLARCRPDRHRVALPVPARSVDQRAGGRRSGDTGRAGGAAGRAPFNRTATRADHDARRDSVQERPREAERPSVWYDIRSRRDAGRAAGVRVRSSLRVAFFTSAPPFLNPDSAGYYVPARNLVIRRRLRSRDLRRTPTYPLFIAARGLVAWARISRRW